MYYQESSSDSLIGIFPSISPGNPYLEMKQLHFFPEISFLPHIQLLITAHHELGSCFWCSDGQKGLLKFILKEFMEEKENLEKKALNSSNDYSKELALLSTEISQATISKYFVLIFSSIT